GGPARRRSTLQRLPDDSRTSGGGGPGQRRVATRPVRVTQQARRPGRGPGGPARRRPALQRQPEDCRTAGGGGPGQRRLATRPVGELLAFGYNHRTTARRQRRRVVAEGARCPGQYEAKRLVRLPAGRTGAGSTAQQAGSVTNGEGPSHMVIWTI